MMDEGTDVEEEEDTGANLRAKLSVAHIKSTGFGYDVDRDHS